jgi:hypothetical protein
MNPFALKNWSVRDYATLAVSDFLSDADLIGSILLLVFWRQSHFCFLIWGIMASHSLSVCFSACCALHLYIYADDSNAASACPVDSSSEANLLA